MWGLAKPVEVTGKITKIVTCCFYCPPKSTRKSMLIDHMTLSLQSLLNKFPKAVISGDRNDLGIDRLLSIDPSQVNSNQILSQSVSFFILIDFLMILSLGESGLRVATPLERGIFICPPITQPKC